jgi:hypothetical protein
MRVRNTDGLQALLHELVSASGVRAFESHSPKIVYEILTRDRSDCAASGNFANHEVHAIENRHW